MELGLVHVNREVEFEGREVEHFGGGVVGIYVWQSREWKVVEGVSE